MSAQPMEFLISTAEQQELFGEFLPPSYGREAAHRWSGTPQWDEAARRVRDYGLLEWQEIAAEQEDWERRMVGLLTDGHPATGPTAMDLAEEQRRGIEHWFHTCTPEHHTRIAAFRLTDASFRARHEGIARGLARYLYDAVLANAARVRA